MIGLSDPFEIGQGADAGGLGDPDFEHLIVDSRIIRAHQHASGAKKWG